MLFMTALQRQKQMYLWGFKAGLVYIESSWTASTMQWNLVSKKGEEGRNKEIRKKNSYQVGFTFTIFSPFVFDKFTFRSYFHGMLPCSLYPSHCKRSSYIILGSIRSTWINFWFICWFTTQKVIVKSLSWVSELSFEFSIVLQTPNTLEAFEVLFHAFAWWIVSETMEKLHFIFKKFPHCVLFTREDYFFCLYLCT